MVLCHLGCPPLTPGRAALTAVHRPGCKARSRVMVAVSSRLLSFHEWSQGRAAPCSQLPPSVSSARLAQGSMAAKCATEIMLFLEILPIKWNLVRLREVSMITKEWKRWGSMITKGRCVKAVGIIMQETTGRTELRCSLGGQHPVFWMVPGHWCCTAPQGRGHLQTLLGPRDGHLSVFSQLRSPHSSPLHLPGHGSLPLPRPRQPLSPSLRSQLLLGGASSGPLQSHHLLPLSSQPAGGWGFYWGNICLPSPVWLLLSSITCEVESLCMKYLDWFPFSDWTPPGLII